MLLFQLSLLKSVIINERDEIGEIQAEKTISANHDLFSYAIRSSREEKLGGSKKD